MLIQIFKILREEGINILNFASSHKYSLSKHVKNVHQKSEKIICTECNKPLQKRWMSEHMKKFHSEEQSLFYCKVCTFQTIHSGSLKIHVQNIHKANRNKKIN